MTATTFTGTATFTSWDEEPAWDSGAPVPRLAHTSASRSVMAPAGQDGGHG